MRTATLMGFVAICALAITSLTHANSYYASAFFTFDIFLLLAFATVAVARPGRSRAMCSGALIFGGGYLWLTFFIHDGSNTSSQPPWITSALIESSRPWVFHRDRVVVDSELKNSMMDDPKFQVMTGFTIRVAKSNGLHVAVIDQPPRLPPVPEIADATNYRRVAHCLLALILMAVGAVIGQVSASRGRPEG
jgi:hypothetical protein